MSMIAITLSAAALAGTPTADFRLTVLHTNDTESKLLYPSSSQQAYGGVARFKTKVDQLRAAADAEGGVVMVSSGDNVLAGPEWNASLSLPAGSRYYDAVGLQAIGYDAICIGNHDFDFGPEILANLINGFTDGTPFLSSNLDVTPEPSLASLAAAGRIRASVTTTTDGRTIGFVGATTTDLPFISTPGDVIVNTDVAERIQAQVDALTAKGVKYIVVMTHLQGISAERLLAQSLRNVDVLVAGGGDELLWNAGQLLVPDDAVDANNDGVPDIRYGAYPLYESDAEGKQLPIITTRGDYRYVGRLVVDFDADGNVLAVDPTSGPVRVASTAQADGVVEDAAVKAAVTDPVAASVAGLAANVIAQSAVALDGRTSVIRTKETNEGNLCADSLLWQAQQLAVQEGLPLPVMSFQNGGGIRNNSILAAGNFTELNTFQILPFSNFVAIVPNVSMATIKALLENAVSRVSPSPGYPSSGNGRFAQVGGFSFSYFVDTVPGQRVRDVVLEDGTVLFDEGVAVNPKATVAIATIDFLCRGGDEYPLNGLPFENLGVSYQQALFNYVTQGLGGQITAAEYPTAGEGRIVRIDSPADFDNNSIVNGADLVVLLGQWGGPGSADLNGSGTVDGDDFAMFLATWTEPGIPE